ncbi:MAG: DUF177 domain-containing protein [Gemmiger sp.]|nr:DUF177 domain-containing protein [Gemmiger sp.]
MRFDMKSFLDSGIRPYEQPLSEDFSGAGFTGFSVPAPATGSFYAALAPEGIAMRLTLQATIEAECARCLAPITQSYHFTREYLVTPTDLEDPDFELPLAGGGCLDVSELAYQELIFEVPPVLLCSPDCLGLCPICGKGKAAGCSCQPADVAAPADARLGILKQLLS